MLRYLKKKKNKLRSFLEFGCRIAPITTSIYEFLNLPKKYKIYIADIKTIAFHYAAYKFRKNSNVIPILLLPENHFLLNEDFTTDLIFCIDVFEHLNKPFETIKIFKNILNKNGILMFNYIKSEGYGTDSMQSVRERDNVLEYILKHFKIISGNIHKNRNTGLTIVKKVN